MQADRRWILDIAREMEGTGRLGELRQYMQHGNVSVYDHSLGVAMRALALMRRFHLKLDTKSMVRGALLHDYFLYDWHVPDPNRPLHGFAHPRIALMNARRDYTLNRIEADIIRRHMFPLTPVPPATAEGWVVCLADTLCAVTETVRPARLARTVRRLLPKGVLRHGR